MMEKLKSYIILLKERDFHLSQSVCLATGLDVIMILMISLIHDKLVWYLLVTKHFLSAPANLSPTGVSSKATYGID